MLPVFPSTREARRRERRLVWRFFLVMGLLAVLFGGALAARVGFGW